MSYILFEAGDYGKKGNWQGENFQNLINDIKELDIIPFHTSEFVGKGILKNEIPIIGKFKNIKIEDNKIIANDIEVFNKNNFKDRNVDRLSVEIENGRIKRVGALPYGVSPAVSTTSSLKGIEFQKDNWISKNDLIIFSRGENMNLDELLAKLGDLSLEEKTKTVNTILKSLKEHEIEVAKKEIDLEIFKEKVEQKTEEQIKEEVKKEFQKEQEIKEFMRNNENKITPAMKSLGIETLIGKVLKDNDGIVEFSENGENKKTNSVEILNKMFANMKSYEKGSVEFSTDDDNSNKSYAESEIEKYKKRNGVK